MDMALPPDIRAVVRRQRSPSERRVTTCMVDLGGAWYAPAATRASGTGTASDAECPKDSSSEGGTELAPPVKVQRPEGVPEAGSTLAPYRPLQVEDDEVMGGTDEIGMAPEIEVDLETECEDLNADIMMDRQSDSPHPPSL